MSNTNTIPPTQDQTSKLPRKSVQNISFFLLSLFFIYSVPYIIDNYKYMRITIINIIIQSLMIYLGCMCICRSTETLIEKGIRLYYDNFRVTDNLRKVGKVFEALFLLMAFNIAVCVTFILLAATAPIGMFPSVILSTMLYSACAPMVVIPLLLPPEQRWSLLEVTSPYLIFSSLLAAICLLVTREVFPSWIAANAFAFLSIVIGRRISLRLRSWA
jgi:hypothetical protein